MTIDLERVRRDTPGCEDVLHLDHAGSSLPPDVVVDTVCAHLRREAQVGGYRAAAEVEDQLSAVYTSVASLLGAETDEVALVDSATRAWQLAFSSVPMKQGDRILCSRVEYASNVLACLQARDRIGVEVVAVPSNASGEMDLDALEVELKRGAAMVVLTHVPTNGGIVQPAGEVGDLCRRYDVPLLLDACQAAGQVDLRNVPWDFVSASGRKYLRGPRGTGFLGVRRAWLERSNAPLADLAGAVWTEGDGYLLDETARRYELWERSIADVLGLGAAVRYALELGIEAVEAAVESNGAALRGKLAASNKLRVVDQGSRRCGIVSIDLSQADPQAVKLALREQDIHVSVSRRPSTRFDMEDRGLTALLRASVHYLTTEEEMNRFVRALDAVL